LTDSRNSDTTAPSGRELYHLQFSLQAASLKTFGYTLITYTYLIRLLLFLVNLWTSPTEAPNTPCSTSHIHFPLSVSFQRFRPCLRSCVTFSNIQLSYSKGLLAVDQHIRWRTSLCRLSVITYSVYSHLSFIYGGRLLHPQPEYAPCRDDRDPLIMVTAIVSFHRTSRRHEIL
jgi:hypothetical protein